MTKATGLFVMRHPSLPSLDYPSVPCRREADLSAAAEFDAVSKRYAGGPFRPAVQAVEGISFRVPAGGVFALLGPNRAGKTTLVKMLLSLCRPTAGVVTRLGRPASDRSTLARVGYMHENHAFPRHLGA